MIASLAMATLAMAQSLSDLPSCALPCLEDAVKGTSCSVDDFACICKDFDAIQGKAAGCILSACGQDTALSKSQHRLVSSFCLVNASLTQTRQGPSCHQGALRQGPVRRQQPGSHLRRRACQHRGCRSHRLRHRFGHCHGHRRAHGGACTARYCRRRQSAPRRPAHGRRRCPGAVRDGDRHTL